jgi:hypothetical protein
MRDNSHPGRSLPFAILSTVAFTAIFGCGGQPRSSVSGKVTLDDQPVAAGQIVFEPQGAGRVGIAQISEGIYTMPAGQGPTAGKYVVRITANRPTGRKATAGRGGDSKTQVDQYEQFIPVKYNELSELMTEVGEEGQIVRDFALKSK